MKVVIQRTLDAKCIVKNKITGKIDKGFMILVGFCENDDINDVLKVTKKIINLRIFEDENEKMNLSIKDVNGSILSVSQFTLYAKLDGRRPSFSKAMKFNEAKVMYDKFNEELRKYNIKVETGIFGEDMKINFTNDGPVTILIDSKEL